MDAEKKGLKSAQDIDNEIAGDHEFAHKLFPKAVSVHWQYHVIVLMLYLFVFSL